MHRPMSRPPTSESTVHPVHRGLGIAAAVLVTVAALAAPTATTSVQAAPAENPATTADNGFGWG